LRFFTAAKRRADSVGAKHVLHKIDGGAYLGLNRKILADLVEAAGLPHMVFHNFKAVCVEAMAVAGHSLAAMSDFSFTRPDTLNDKYRPGVTSETRKDVAQGFDVAIGGSREEWERLPDRTLGGAARGRNEGLGEALVALTEALDRTYAEANEAAARRASRGPTSRETRPIAEAAVAEAPDDRWRETVPAVRFGGAPRRRLSAAIIPNRRELSKREWAIFAPLARMRAGLGQPFDENVARRALNGMIRLAVTGESWRALPAVYGDSSTVRRAHVRWLQSGVFDAARDRALGDRSLTTPERDLLVETCEGLAALRDRPFPAKRAAPIDASAVSTPLTDEEWEICSALVGGRRLQLDALLWLAETRRPLRSLPEELGDVEAARWRRKRMVATGALDDLVSELEEGGGPPGRLGPEARAALAQRLRAIAPAGGARARGAPAAAFAPSAVAAAPA
jgi:transposase